MVAGSTWMISSNSDEVLRAAQESFQPARDGVGTTEMKRFAPTSFETVVEVCGASIGLQTNYEAVADRLRRARTRTGSADAPDFVARIVREPEEDLELGPAFGILRLSRDGLSFIGLGYKSFHSCDQRPRQGISFVFQSRVTDEKRFSQFFLPTLISLLRESIEASSCIER